MHDILSFLPSGDSNSIMFLWASEEAGFRHLYVIKSELRPALSYDWPKDASIGTHTFYKFYCEFHIFMYSFYIVFFSILTFRPVLVPQRSSKGLHNFGRLGGYECTNRLQLRPRSHIFHWAEG